MTTKIQISKKGLMPKKQKNKKSVNPSAGNPHPKGFIFTPFRYSTDRLSIAKSVEQIYSDRGTIYWSATNEQDTPRWNHYLDKQSDQLIMNHYGRSVNKVGEDVSKSELVLKLMKFPQIMGKPSNDTQSLDTGKPSISVYANQTHAAHERFQDDMKAAMMRNAFASDGPNQVGMLNDTKRKEMIDSISAGKETDAKKFINVGGSTRKDELKENASKKYEDRYKKSKDHVSKKKQPNYTSGPMIKYDEYNKLYPLPDPTDSLVKIPDSEKLWRDWDFVPFILHDIVNKKYIPFRSFINSISDQSDAEWQDVRYIGRADNVQIYTGFTRQVSIDFTVAAFSLKELHPMWQRLNYLVGLTKPAGYTSQVDDESSVAIGGFIIPPFLKLNIGDMYVDQPVVMPSVAITIPPEAAWELTSDEVNRSEGYQYLNNTFTTKKEDNVLVAQYPNMAQVTLSFKFLEKRLPKLNNRHFGHWRSEDEPVSEDTHDNGPIMEQGFNYNLIYPNPSRKIPEPTGVVGGDGPEGELAKKPAEPDPFEGTDNPSCTSYPPSKHYIGRTSGMKKTKKPGRYKSDLESWKSCACENTAALMGIDQVTSCDWNGTKCIETINGKKVPEGMTCMYTSAFNDEPREEEDDIKEPPRCPYPVGGYDEKNDEPDGDLIGYLDKDLYEKKDAKYMASLELRNLNLWLREVADWIADEIGQPHIGSGPFTFDVYKLTPGHQAKTANGELSAEPEAKRRKDPGTRSNIFRVYSKTGAVWMEFNGNGQPHIYNGERAPSAVYGKFKINCTPEEIEEIREIAGNTQPVIIGSMRITMNSSSGVIKLDKNGSQQINPNNYKKVDEVRKLLAEFVSREIGTTTSPNIPSPEDDTGTRKHSLTDAMRGHLNTDQYPLSKWGDLAKDAHKGTGIETDDMYYIPYEDDRNKMIKGHKVYPGTYEYTYYKYDDNVESRLNLPTDTEGSKISGQGMSELTIGFYALVSKTKQRISSTPVDIESEDDLADMLWDRLYKYNGYTNIEHGTDKDGNKTRTNVKHEAEAGDGFKSDDEMAYQLDPSDTGRFVRERERLQKALVAEDENIPFQLANPKIPVLNYRIVGAWNKVQRQELLERMADMQYQPIIAKHYNGGATRNAIENHLMLLLGTEEEDIATATTEYKARANKGTLMRPDPEAEKETDTTYLVKKIEDQEHFLLEIERKVDMGEIKGNKGLEEQGVYFENKTSDGHFEPWVKDHLLEKIEWVNTSWTNPPKDPESSQVPRPEPTTDTPTPNRKPTWQWPSVPDAKLYEIKFLGVTTVTEDNYFTPPNILAIGTHIISVKAGVPARSGSGTDWSTPGSHEVQIDKRATPPKPPKCPYAVGEVGATDQYTRSVGPKTSDEAVNLVVDRNLKMWMGDVMAYIVADQNIGNLTYPCDPGKVDFVKDNFGYTSVYEQNKLEWMGYDGNPWRLNGKRLVIPNDDSGISPYLKVFDFTCGPTLDDPDKGGDVTTQPSEPLKTPEPTAESPTTNSKPEFTWVAVDEATAYRVSLAKVNDTYVSPGVYAYKPEIDYGVIQYSKELKAFPLLALKEGFYQVTVIAEKKQNGKLERTSKKGEYVFEVKDPAPITSLETPNPSTKSPTNELKIKWSWASVTNATRYEVSLNTTKPAGDIDDASNSDEYEIVENLGVVAESPETEYEMTFVAGGYYELSVIAKNDELVSEPGTHVVHIDPELKITEDCGPPPPETSPQKEDTYTRFNLRDAETKEFKKPQGDEPFANFIGGNSTYQRQRSMNRHVGYWKSAVCAWIVCDMTGKSLWKESNTGEEKLPQGALTVGRWMWGEGDAKERGENTQTLRPTTIESEHFSGKVPQKYRDMFREYKHGRPDLTFGKWIKNWTQWDPDTIYSSGKTVWYGVLPFFPKEDLEADRDEMKTKYAGELKNVWTVVSNPPSAPFEWPHGSNTVVTSGDDYGDDSYQVPPGNFKWESARFKTSAYVPGVTDVWAHASSPGTSIPDNADDTGKHLDTAPDVCSDDNRGAIQDWYRKVALMVVKKDWNNNDGEVQQEEIKSSSSRPQSEGVISLDYLSKPERIVCWPYIVELEVRGYNAKEPRLINYNCQQIAILAKEGGYGLSDPSKTLEAVCVVNSTPGTKADFTSPQKYGNGTQKWWVGDGGTPPEKTQFWKNSYEI